MRRLLMLIVVALALAVPGLLAPSPAPAAMDMFLDLETIPGESRDTAHRDAIDVLAWSWGVSRTPATRTRPAVARPADLKLTKYVDKASAPLYAAVATGKTINSARLLVRKAGATPLEFFELCMQNVKVNSLHTGGSGGEDRLTEQIDLTGVIFSMRYTPQNADGTPGTAMRAGFDFSQNPAQPVTAGC